MEIIGKSELWSFADTGNEARKTTSGTVRKNRGHRVTSYMDLAKKVAELQFRNPEHVLLFRGQGGDHKSEEGLTTLKPTLFRSAKGQMHAPDRQLLDKRFSELKDAERNLLSRWSQRPGKPKLSRSRLLRWSILQHYEVCRTPLLDVTHSLRIAASFASDMGGTEAFVFVLGVPNLSGAVTASAEAGLQIVRLSSVCPPNAVRPHIQEGYLLGEYPEMPDFDQKQHYRHFEIDFGRRLIAKFRFDPRTFWATTEFPAVPHNALYPPADVDPLRTLLDEIKRDQE